MFLKTTPTYGAAFLKYLTGSRLREEGISTSPLLHRRQGGWGSVHGGGSSACSVWKDQEAESLGQDGLTITLKAQASPSDPLPPAIPHLLKVTQLA